MQSIIQPKEPAPDNGWRRAAWWKAPAELVKMGYPVIAFEHLETGLFVLSALEVIDGPGEPDLGPEWHISISKNQRRCTSAEALFVLHHFGMDDAREDNHVPNGVVRNFWRHVADNLSGYECPCVDEEPAMREDKGDFVYRGVD